MNETNPIGMYMNKRVTAGESLKMKERTKKTKRNPPIDDEKRRDTKYNGFDNVNVYYVFSEYADFGVETLVFIVSSIFIVYWSVRFRSSSS